MVDVRSEVRRRILPELVLAEAFPAQRAFIEDKSRRKAAFVLRRGGKSTAVAIYLLYTALTNPVTKSLYIASTKDSAENIMWLNCFEPLLLRLNIPFRFNRTTKTIILENKSTIQLTGADASQAQITKYLGGKYKLVCIDEAQDIRQDLRAWIDRYLGPAMIDYQGTIAIIGTAGRSIGRYWHSITVQPPKVKGWAVHRWGAQDNPHMAELLTNEIASMIATTPGIEQTPDFQNQYYCRWVIDSDDRCYHNSDRNLLTHQPTIESLRACDPKWRYIIGFDFGYNDPTGFCVAAFSDHDPCMYIVESYKKAGMLEDDVGRKLIQLRDKYQPIYMVGDCQSKQFVESVRIKYQLPLRPADKLGKEAHIAAMNSDFAVGRIKVIEETNKPLIDEWASLIWDERKRTLGIFQELASRDNHLADSALYAHHFSKHFLATPAPLPDPQPQATEAVRRFMRSASMDADNDAFALGDTYNPYDDIDRTLGTNR